MSGVTLERSAADLAPARTGVREFANPGAAVSLSRLEKHYGGVGAVRGISLEIRSGEFLTLLGPSGSGKTTTLMMIAGFETPSAGDIMVDGRSVTAIPPNKRNLGMVFQNYALFPHLTVADNIGFPLKQRGVDRATRARLVGEALEVVRLPGYGGRHPRQLSGGQQQRVALARAIVFRPRLLLMDEPLGALDKQLREGLQLELRRLHAELGITFIYVTHDQDEALTMSDRIAVVNEGVIAQLGTPEDLYDRPSNRFVASFIGESNFLSGMLQGFEGDQAVVSLGGSILRASAATRPSVGDPVTLTMRPERVHFADDRRVTDASDNRLRATVTEAVFAGDCCRYHCRVADGESFVVKQPCGATVRRHRPGDAVELAWSAADTSLV
jgi:spermidine/putrescine ABC transporter ATP-binding subunit